MMHPVHIVSAAGLVTRPDDQVLLVKTPRRGWEFPGGQVEMGESVPDAVLREILEESGITARVTRFVGVYSNLGVGYDETGSLEKPPILNLTFLCDYVSGEPCASEETTEAGWFSRVEARRLVTFPAFVKRLEDMLNCDGSVRFRSFVKESDLREGILYQQELCLPASPIE